MGSLEGHRLLLRSSIHTPRRRRCSSTPLRGERPWAEQRRWLRRSRRSMHPPPPSNNRLHMGRPAEGSSDCSAHRNRESTRSTHRRAPPVEPGPAGAFEASCRRNGFAHRLTKLDDPPDNANRRAQLALSELGLHPGWAGYFTISSLRMKFGGSTSRVQNGRWLFSS
jgi:hypothetical protein